MQEHDPAISIAHNCYDDRCESPNTWVWLDRKNYNRWKFDLKREKSYVMYIPASLANCGPCRTNPNCLL